jgi:hypothetical protein
VPEFDREGEEYWNKRLFVVGVDGKPDAVAVGRVGDTGLRGEGGVTSVCSIEVKMEFACSRYREIIF